MKNGKVCPKCGGRDIVVMGALGGGPWVRVSGPRTDNTLRVEQYVCCTCGYMESWVAPEEFVRRGGKEYWEGQRQIEEAGLEFERSLAYYSEKARQEREQPVKAPQETKKKRREDPWT